ncbi:MAG: IclR family transcriptional regulator [Firmicutes bacterium]|nr:IclR family transcriptional regulator [Bacillota bacterium]
MRTYGGYSSMLEKGLAIIELLAEAKQPLKITELAEKLSIPRPTIYRLIGSLETHSYVRRVGERPQYFLSLRFLQLGEIVRNSLELRKLAYPYMERLRDEVELAVHLVVRDGNEAVYVEKVESRRPVRLFTQVGRRVPLHVTACPRVLLAFCSEEEIKKYLSVAKMVKFTATTVADSETLWARIHEIRSKGYSMAYGELEPETAAVAVPVRNHREEVVAALSLAGPEWHFKAEELGNLVAQLQKYALNISREFGYVEATNFPREGRL